MCTKYAVKCQYYAVVLEQKERKKERKEIGIKNEKLTEVPKLKTIIFYIKKILQGVSMHRLWTFRYTQVQSFWILGLIVIGGMVRIKELMKLDCSPGILLTLREDLEVRE